MIASQPYSRPSLLLGYADSSHASSVPAIFADRVIPLP
jgi:hypothetical protein